MNTQNTQAKILQLITQSKFAIIDFQEELLELENLLDVNDPKEQEILVSMNEDINFIVSTITVNCMKLEKLSKQISENEAYFLKNEKDVEGLLNMIEDFNSKVIIKE
jgi:hypothetical protein